MDNTPFLKYSIDWAKATSTNKYKFNTRNDTPYEAAARKVQQMISDYSRNSYAAEAAAHWGTHSVPVDHRSNRGWISNAFRNTWRFIKDEAANPRRAWHSYKASKQLEGIRDYISNLDPSIRKSVEDYATRALTYTNGEFAVPGAASTKLNELSTIAANNGTTDIHDPRVQAQYAEHLRKKLSGSSDFRGLADAYNAGHMANAVDGAVSTALDLYTLGSIAAIPFTGGASAATAAGTRSLAKKLLWNYPKATVGWAASALYPSLALRTAAGGASSAIKSMVNNGAKQTALNIAKNTFSKQGLSAVKRNIIPATINSATYGYNMLSDRGFANYLNDWKRFRIELMRYPSYLIGNRDNGNGQ